MKKLRNSLKNRKNIRNDRNATKIQIRGQKTKGKKQNIETNSRNSRQEETDEIGRKS